MGNKMNITHVVSSPVNAAAGVKEMYMHLSGAQSESSFHSKVSVVALDHPDWNTERASWCGAPVHLVKVFGPRVFGFAPTMVDTICDQNPDIVHLHGLWMHSGRSVLNWSKISSRPYVVSTHGMLSNKALSYSKLKKRFLLSWFQLEVLQRASAIHVTSDSEEQCVRDFGLKNRIINVPNGVPPYDLPSKNEANFSKEILYLGRLHSIKGLDSLLVAWEKLQFDFPDWRLHLVGPAEYGELYRLKNIVRSRKLDRVFFSGEVRGECKLSIMANASIFVLPSLSENFGITVAESLMLATPVICSKGAPWSGISDHDCGLWVEIGSVPLYNSLRSLMLLPPSILRDMGARGREWMLREFCWDIIAKKILREYQIILDDYSPCRN